MIGSNTDSADTDSMKQVVTFQNGVTFIFKPINAVSICRHLVSVLRKDLFTAYQQKNYH